MHNGCMFSLAYVFSLLPSFPLALSSPCRFFLLPVFLIRILSIFPLPFFPLPYFPRFRQVSKTPQQIKPTRWLRRTHTKFWYTHHNRGGWQKMLKYVVVESKDYGRKRD